MSCHYGKRLKFGLFTHYFSCNCTSICKAVAPPKIARPIDTSWALCCTRDLELWSQKILTSIIANSMAYHDFSHAKIFNFGSFITFSKHNLGAMPQISYYTEYAFPPESSYPTTTLLTELLGWLSVVRQPSRHRKRPLQLDASVKPALEETR
jgi:hypothetical protein